MNAIIQISGKQFNVSVGDSIDVDRVDAKENTTVSLDHIVIFGDNKKILIGSSKQLSAGVKAKVVKHFLGNKTDIRRFRAKVRFRRRRGFRPKRTKLQITSIQ